MRIELKHTETTPKIRIIYRVTPGSVGYFSVSFRGERYKHGVEIGWSSSGPDNERSRSFEIFEMDNEDAKCGVIIIHTETSRDREILEGIVFQARSKETEMFLLLPRDQFVPQDADDYATLEGP